MVLPALESTGLRAGTDFHLCFSSERVNPGDKTHPVGTIPRVVGGVTPACADLAAQLYGRIAPEVVTVSMPAAAEMARLIEKHLPDREHRARQRAGPHVPLVRHRRVGGDRGGGHQALRLHALLPGTGPEWALHPHRPALPLLEGAAERLRPALHRPRRQVNSAMPRFVVSLVAEVLNERSKSLKGSRVLVSASGTRRTSTTPGSRRRSRSSTSCGSAAPSSGYHDPYVARLDVGGRAIASVPLDDSLIAGADCVLVTTDHTCVDYKRVVEPAPLVVDTRSVTRGVAPYRDNVVRL